MYFDSFQAALAMDGHGAYVWSAYAVTLLVLIYLVTSPWLRQKKLLRQLRGESRRNQQRTVANGVENPH